MLPTNTWQAYNLYDADGDGWGDTWYAGGRPPVVLTRAYRDRGVPPRFRRYDFPFLRFLEKTRREPDFLADDDLDAIATGDDLRALYDLVVFPGHTEYVTAHAYDVVERFPVQSIRTGSPISSPTISSLRRLGSGPCPTRRKVSVKDGTSASTCIAIRSEGRYERRVHAASIPSTWTTGAFARAGLAGRRPP